MNFTNKTSRPKLSHRINRLRWQLPILAFLLVLSHQLYFTATSNSGQPVTAQMSGMHRMGGMMACVTCHALAARAARFL